MSLGKADTGKSFRNGSGLRQCHCRLERDQKSLKNALPQQIFTKVALEAKDLKAVVDDINKIDPKRFQDKDLIGRVYEYYLQAFSINADKEEGEFYTPHSIVEGS